MKPTGKQLRTDPGYRNTNMDRSSLLVHSQGRSSLQVCSSDKIQTTGNSSGQIQPIGTQIRTDPAYRYTAQD